MFENATVLKTYKAYLFNRINSIEVKVEQMLSANKRQGIFYRIDGANYTHDQYWQIRPIPVIES